MICVVVCNFFAILEGYIIDEGLHMERKEGGDKIHSGCKKIEALIFKSSQLMISQMMHDLNLFSCPSSAGHPLPILPLSRRSI
jgi:hypothetical protein